MAEQNKLSADVLTPKRIALLSVIALWLTFQILFPLRHLLYPGNVSWTEEGHRFSWQMKLRDKKSEIFFTVVNPQTKQAWEVWPQNVLMRHQGSMQTQPDMILQFAHYLEQVWREDYNIEDVEVRARVCTSLNGRPIGAIDRPRARPHRGPPKSAAGRLDSATRSAVRTAEKPDTPTWPQVLKPEPRRCGPGPVSWTSESPCCYSTASAISANAACDSLFAVTLPRASVLHRCSHSTRVTCSPPRPTRTKNSIRLS